MRHPECDREAEVLEALQISAWPDCCADHLRLHVASCRSCTELADIVVRLFDDYRAALRDARVPSSAAVWWRLQMRARQEAARRATRPIAVLQGVALACAAGLLAAAIGLSAPAWRRFAGSLAGWGAGVAATIPSMAWGDVQMFSPLGLSVALTAMLLFVAMSVAVYFAVSEK
ncbi:MAG: hypothetical protein AB1806_06575 [Acidobacteriota bacterium]